ncbi:MAG: GNAT family N-acetyltransferase [Bacteroidetes bacterium]|nr:GNAT family N-acetyltransferase [Bacteroidota bacterium]
MLILKTERLDLREFTPDDAIHLFNLNSDPEVVKYTGDGPYSSIEEARTFLEGYTCYFDYGMGRWAVIHRETGAWLGWCGLKFHPETGEVDIGFRFFREHWGKGYATESAKACLDYGFETLGLFQISGRALVDNLASIKVLVKIGLERKTQVLDDTGLWEVWEKIRGL